MQRFLQKTDKDIHYVPQKNDIQGFGLVLKEENDRSDLYRRPDDNCYKTLNNQRIRIIFKFVRRQL